MATSNEIAQGPIAMDLQKQFTVQILYVQLILKFWADTEVSRVQR